MLSRAMLSQGSCPRHSTPALWQDCGRPFWKFFWNRKTFHISFEFTPSGPTILLSILGTDSWRFCWRDRYGSAAPNLSAAEQLLAKCPSPLQWEPVALFFPFPSGCELMTWVIAAVRAAPCTYEGPMSAQIWIVSASVAHFLWAKAFFHTIHFYFQRPIIEQLT